MSNVEILLEEIGGKLPKGKGCINFDFACLFPYDNQEVLTFDFGLGKRDIGNYKHNHRYPNKGYVTISKKLGRKVSKIGFPYLVDLNDEQPILLWIKVGIKDKAIRLVFPISIMVTENEPIATLTGYFNFDKSKFSFSTYKYIPDDKCYQKISWSNDEKYLNDIHVIIMDKASVHDDNHTIVYHTPIIISSQSVEHCIL